MLRFLFCRHFHLYITESHILCAYYIKALVCFLSAKSVQKSVYKAQPIFSPYRVKRTRPPFVVLFFFLKNKWAVIDLLFQVQNLLNLQALKESCQKKIS